MAKIQEIGEQIKAKRSRVAELFSSTKQTDGSFSLSPEQRDEVKRLNDELNDIVPKYEQAVSDARAEEENARAIKMLERVDRPRVWGGDDPTHTPAIKSVNLGERFVASQAYKSFLARGREEGSRSDFNLDLPDVDLKAVFLTTSGWDPFVQRDPRLVLSAQQGPVVADLIPMIETGQAAVKWMLETTYTSGAAEAAENATVGESTFVLTEQTSAVRKIGVTLPYTEEQMEDEPRTRDYLQNRLTLQLRQRLDNQLLNGNGTAPNLRGILNVAGIQTQAKSTDPVFDAIFKAMIRVQYTGFANPTGLILHPTDWQNMRLTRTVDGIYILGNPDTVAPARVWGLPIVSTTFATLGTGIVGDFAMYSELAYRRGIAFDVTNSHASEFINFVSRLRASLRAAFYLLRPAAFCTITGL